MSVKRTAGAALTTAGVIVLCGLGAWQVQRLQWKDDIIARLAHAREHPQSMSVAALQTLDQESTLPLVYGTARGHLMSDKEVVVGPRTNDKGEIGYHLITPLKVPGGAILVDRGWVPEYTRDPTQRGHMQRGSHITYVGIFRRPDYNRFASGNNPAGDQWMRLDVDDIAQAKMLYNPAPLVLYAEQSDTSITGETLNTPGWAPRNNHRQYAIFWFTMAGVLAAFYAVVAWRGRGK